MRAVAVLLLWLGVQQPRRQRGDLALKLAGESVTDADEHPMPPERNPLFTKAAHGGLLSPQYIIEPIWEQLCFQRAEPSVERQVGAEGKRNEQECRPQGCFEGEWRRPLSLLPFDHP